MSEYDDWVADRLREIEEDERRADRIGWLAAGAFVAVSVTVLVLALVGP